MRDTYKTVVQWAVGCCAILVLAISTAIAAQSDVTTLLSITRSGLVLNRATNTYDQTVSIKNSSNTIIGAPVTLAITGLPSSVSLANATGTTTAGKPYIAVPLPSGGVLSSGTSTVVVIKFANPKRNTITATLNVFGDINQFSPPSDWPTFSGKTNGIAFPYANFGRSAKIVINKEVSGVIQAYIYSNAPNGRSINEYALWFVPNDERLTLTDWFEKYVDDQGALIASGAFTVQTLPNGVSAYVRSSGPIPDQTAEAIGPVSQIYAISSSGKTIIEVDVSQVNDLDVLGVTYDTARQAFLVMLANMSAP